VDLVTATNVTWEDAFQFDPTGPTGTNFVPFTGTGPAWTLTGQNFRFSIKSNWLQPKPLIEVDSGVGPNQTVIVIQDVNSRIISTSVPDVALFGSAYPGGITGYTGVTGPGLIPGRYCYDLVMYDGSTPPVKIGLMHGIFELQVGQGRP
jgi:hypothetical protein